jgi:hypothetical protein
VHILIVDSSLKDAFSISSKQSTSRLNVDGNTDLKRLGQARKSKQHPAVSSFLIMAASMTSIYIYKNECVCVCVCLSVCSRLTL